MGSIALPRQCSSVCRRSSMRTTKSWQGRQRPTQKCTNAGYRGLKRISRSYAPHPLVLLQCPPYQLAVVRPGQSDSKAARGIRARAVRGAQHTVGRLRLPFHTQTPMDSVWLKQGLNPVLHWAKAKAVGTCPGFRELRFPQQWRPEGRAVGAQSMEQPEFAGASRMDELVTSSGAC